MVKIYPDSEKTVKYCKLCLKVIPSTSKKDICDSKPCIDFHKLINKKLSYSHYINEIKDNLEKIDYSSFGKEEKMNEFLKFVFNDNFNSLIKFFIPRNLESYYYIVKDTIFSFTQWSKKEMIIKSLENILDLIKEEKMDEFIKIESYINNMMNDISDLPNSGRIVDLMTDINKFFDPDKAREAANEYIDICNKEFRLNPDIVDKFKEIIECCYSIQTFMICLELKGEI